MSDAVNNFYRFAEPGIGVPLWPLAVIVGLQIVTLVAVTLRRRYKR